MYIRIACFWISDEDVRWKRATMNPKGVGNLVHSHINITPKAGECSYDAIVDSSGIFPLYNILPITGTNPERLQRSG